MSSGGRGSNRSTGRAKTERGTGKEARPAADMAAPQDKVKSHTNSKPREEKVFEDKISQVIQLTGKTKDEAEIALFDCDYDPTRAINMLLEGDDQGEWVEKTKKKKLPKPPPPEPKPQEESSRSPEEDRDRERSRSRGGQPPRLRRGAAQDRSWKARESRENEKNAADGGGGGDERPRWAGRGGARGGRGGRRGALGSRSYQPRRGDDFAAIDTWTNPGDERAGRGRQSAGGGGWDQSFPAAEDWDNEEWGGSLTDTKVFTPSASAQPAAPAAPAVADAASPPKPAATPTAPSSLGPSLDLSALLGKAAPAGGVSSSAQTFSQFSAAAAAATAADGDAVRPAPAAIGSTLPSASSAVGGAAGSYSYSSATSRPAAQQATPAAAYPSGYTNPPGLIYSSSGYTSDTFSSQLKSSLASSESSATATSMSQSLPQRSKVQKPRIAPPSKIPESAVEMPGDPVSSLGVKFGGLDFGTADTKSFPASDADSDAFSSGVPASSQELGALPSASQPVKSALESAAAAFPGGAGGASAGDEPAPPPAGYASPAAGLYAGQKPSAGPAGFPPAPSASGASFSQLAASYGGSASAQPGFSQAAAFSTASAPAFSSPATFSQTSAPSSYPSSSYAAAGGAGYSSAYNNGSYAAGGGASGSALTGNSLQEKLTNALSSSGKPSQFDASSGSASSLTSSVSTAASSLPAGLVGGSGPAAASGRSHTATTRSGNMPSVPPGVPMQYFVGQTGMPTFYPGVQQLYGYEEMQALQQRLPHMQQQAANNQGRGDAASALGAAAFSMADAKYSRQDAASPVQSSLNQQSQQQQQQQQFFNAPAIPPNYTYFPFLPQYSIYTPMPPATNAAHQASSTSQYPKMAYNAASFGGSYDSLASAPGGDYKSAGFVGSAGHKLGGSGSAGGGTDLGAVYSKMQLGNKFDNKGFHAATPPPFNLAGQAQTTPLAAPGGYAPHMFIQTLPPQHQMVHPAHQDSAGGGPQRSGQPSKAASKNSYGGGYWSGN